MKNFILLITLLTLSFYSQAQETENPTSQNKNEFGFSFSNLFFNSNNSNILYRFPNTNRDNSIVGTIQNNSNFNLLYKRRINNNFLRIGSSSFIVKDLESEYNAVNFIPGQSAQQIVVTDNSRYQNYSLQIGYEIRKKQTDKMEFYYGPLINPGLVKVSTRANFEDNVTLAETIVNKVVNNTFNIGIGGVFGGMYQLGNSPLAFFAEITPFVNYQINESKVKFVNSDLDTKESIGGFETQFFGNAQLGLLFKF
jgi:hypothetical protein